MKHKNIFRGIYLTLLIPLISTSVYSWTWPTVSTDITSDFGPRYLSGYDWHEAIDIRAPIGTPVYAITGGTVADITTYSTGIKAIHIDHPNGIQSRYLHISQYLVKVGDVVSEGDLIARSGDSGSAGRPHLDLRLGPPSYDNPLYHLQHSAPNYTITIATPTTGLRVCSTQTINGNINSSIGLDLDRIDIYLNKLGENFIDDAHRINESRTIPPRKLQINYGGMPNIACIYSQNWGKNEFLNQRI